MEGLNLRMLIKAECKEKYSNEVSNKFAALEALNSGVEINSAWGTIRGILKVHPNGV
jgi:hypothetical protein